MLFEQPCAIVDLETTGGHITRDRITEIGLILLDGDKVERLQWLVNPGREISPFIEALTGISNAMVADAPPFEAIASTLLTHLEGRLLVAHNAHFDYSFLKNAFRRCQLGFRANSLCTVKLSRKLYPQHFKHNLDSIVARHGIAMPQRHRALADAEAVYRFLLSARAECGMPQFADCSAELMAVPQLPPGMDEALADALPDVAGVYTLYDSAAKPLYVGRCTNLRQRVFAHYGAGKPQRGVPQLSETIAQVSWQETLGEFGAALLETRLVNALRPRHNPRARLQAEPCTLQLDPAAADGYWRVRVAGGGEIDLSRTEILFGLFRSPREAKKGLADLVQAASLCPGILGTETVTARKGCACQARKNRRCRGACEGRESAAEHNARLMAALQRLKMDSWPYPGAIELEEYDEASDERAIHVFDRWCYLGSHNGAGRQYGTPAFDLDVYKLLRQQLRKLPPTLCLRQCPPGAAA